MRGKQNGKTIHYEVKEELMIHKYSGEIKSDYMKK